MNIIIENTKGSYGAVKSVNGVTSYMTSDIYDKKDITITNFTGCGDTYKKLEEPQIVINNGSDRFVFKSLDELIEAIKKPTKKMRLFHGTSSELYDSIMKDGLKTPFLTNSYNLALYYAGEAYYHNGGNKVVLEVCVDEKDLLVDYASLEEPVCHDEKDWEVLESMVAKRYEELSQEHPDWIKGNSLIIPENQYYVSLETVASCKCAVDVAPENIKKYQY